MTTNNDYQCLSANRAPLTAVILNTANLTATVQALAHPQMAVLDVKDMFFTVPDKIKIERKLLCLLKMYNIQLPDSHRSINTHL